MNATISSRTNSHDRTAAIRAAVFFVVFFVAGSVFGGWLTYNFGWGISSEHHLRAIGLSLGLLTLALSAFPLWFALAIARRLRTNQK